MNLAQPKLPAITAFFLIVLSAGLLGLLAALAYQSNKVHHVVFAAGSSTAESYVFATALKRVVERHNRTIRMTVLETGGTVENLKRIEDGSAALGVAQSDVLPGPSARAVAVLYDDYFQLLTPVHSPIKDIAGLRGKNIALPRSGGQFQSFLRVAAHFDLQERDFRFTGDDETDSDREFAAGHADAIFRVRALANPAIESLVRTGRFHLLPIEQAPAMKISDPAFTPSVIPAGAYLGHPAIPATDLPTISVRRNLLASSSIDDDVIRAITEAVMDLRDEIALEIPPRDGEVRLLLSHIRRPDPHVEIGPALHPGALGFYDKDKPPFVLAHADYMGLLLTVFVMVGSWFWELRNWLQRQQKNAADEYSQRVVELIDTARNTQSIDTLLQVRGELLGILTTAVADLDNDRLSEESFNSFRAVLQIGLEVVRDSTTILRATQTS